MKNLLIVVVVFASQFGFAQQPSMQANFKRKEVQKRNTTILQAKKKPVPMRSTVSRVEPLPVIRPKPNLTLERNEIRNTDIYYENTNGNNMILQPAIELKK